MSPIEIGLIGIGLLLFLFFIGVPIAFAMAIAGLAGFAYVVSPAAAYNLIASDVFTNLGSYSLTVLPMFILMGSMAFAAGIGKKAYDVAYTWMGQFEGGLIVATIGACTIFGAVCGSGAATCACIGKIAVPEIKRHKYNPAIALGALACAGTLGFMIPPSNPFIIYGLLTEQSIGKLFISGIIPGIMIALLMMVTALIICKIKPAYGPAGEKTTLKQKMKSLLGLFDALILFGLVIGGMFAGWFTPTMAGAIGSVGAIIIGLARRELTWKRFVDGLKDSLRLSAMIFMLIIGAIIFGHFMTVSGLAQSLVNFAIDTHMGPLGIVIFVSVIFFVLGCFIDITPLLLILVPMFYPLIVTAGIDPIYFGVIIVMLCMLGIVTPPVGTNIFVTKGLVRDEISMATISKGILIFLVPMTLGLVLLIAFPGISTILPKFMSY